MPNYPKRFNAQINEKFQVRNLYGLSPEELENYRQYVFAKKQYDELTAFLCNTNGSLDEKTKEPKGYGKNKYGFEKELDEEMLALIKEKTANLLHASKNFYENIKIGENTNTGAEILMYDARRDYETSVRIYTTLEDVSLSDPISFPEVYNKSTEAIIDLGNTEINTVGASYSNRLALKYVDEKGKINKGFFTKDKETGKKINFTSAKKKHPELAKTLTQVEHFLNEENGEIPTDANDYLLGEIKTPQELINLLYALGADGDYLENVSENFYTIEEVQDIIDPIKDFNNNNEINRLVGIKVGNNSNQRNTFMSDMAEVLGRPDILAKSRPMTIIENGEVVHGNFMENAKGIDYNDIKPENPAINMCSIGVDYEKVLPDIADMMIIDYICLNGDRHQNNMFYQFSQEKDGGITLVGIQGIDNDLSFGNKIPKGDEEVKFLPSLNNTKYITRSMMEKVSALTQEKIYSMYAGKGLSEEEIEACWERTQNIQDKIKKKGFRIIEDREYKKEPKTEFEETQRQNNAKEIFEKISKLNSADTISPANNIQNMLYFYEEKWNIVFNEFRSEKHVEISEKEKDARIKEGLKGLQQKVFLDVKSQIKNQSAQISRLSGKLWRPGKKDIPEYEALYRNLKALDKTLKDFKKDKIITKKGEISLTDEMKHNILTEKFKDTEALIQAYQTKISAKPSRNDKKRIAITESIKSIAIDCRNSRELLTNQVNTSMVKAMKVLDNLGKKASGLKEELKTNKNKAFEFKLAEMKMNATANLASYLGIFEMPKEEEKLKTDRDIARICIANRLYDLEKEDPKSFCSFVKMANDKPELCLNAMTDALSQNKDFKRIMTNVNLANAIMTDTPERVKKLAEEMGVFEAIGIKLDTLVNQKNQETIVKM